MPFARYAATLMLLSLTCLAAAQQRPGGTGGGTPRGTPTQPTMPGQTGPTELYIRVTLENDLPVMDHMQLRVELVTMGTVPIAQTYVDSTGRARLQVERPGQYRVRVTGADIEETISDELLIMQSERMRTEYVRVKLRQDSELARKLHGGMISAANLNIPRKAKKEFDKGNEAMGKQQWEEAIARFQSAVREHPQFDNAFNHLGVAYMRAGNAAKGREAFEKAVELNQQNGGAQLNLARLYFSDKNYPEAEARAQKAVALLPSNPDALTMLAVVQITSGKVDDALSTSRKVHDVPHEQFALAHLVAARAYEAKKQQSDAVREYQTFLKEAPEHPRSKEIREALDKMGQGAAAQK